MTNTREENADELAREETDRARLAEAVEQALSENPYYEDVARELYAADDVDFDEWCARLGVDPSFVGNGSNVPGYVDIFDAAIEKIEEELAPSGP